MRKQAEANEAATVLTRTGQVSESSRAKMPALAAVSPKRESGPWKLGVRKAASANFQYRCSTPALTGQLVGPHSTS